MSSVLDFMNKFNAAAAARSSNRTKPTKVPNGDSRWRLLPYKHPDDPNQFWQYFGMHFVKNKAGENKAHYVCVESTYNRDCPICTELSNRIAASTSDDDTKVLNQARASKRVMVNALPIGADGKVGTEPVILELPASALDKLMSKAADYLVEEGEEANYNPLTDAAKGTHIKISRDGTGLSTKYDYNLGRKAVPVKQEVLDKMHDLASWAKQEYAEGQSKALAAVRSVAGALPAPAAKSSLFVEEDVPFTPSPMASKAGTIVDDELDAIVSSSDDDELDDLLASVG